MRVKKVVFKCKGWRKNCMVDMCDNRRICNALLDTYSIDIHKGDTITITVKKAVK